MRKSFSHYFFSREKVIKKRPSREKMLTAAFLLATPPGRNPCGTNYVCATHDQLLAVLSIYYGKFASRTAT